MARDLIGGYEAKYKAEYAINAEAYERLMNLCELADMLFEEFSADPIDIQISMSQAYGAILIYTDDLIFKRGRSHPFFTSIKDADFLKFSKSDSGMLQTKFGVNNLWVKK